MIEAGMKYAEFTPEMLVILRAASERSVLPEWVKRAGGPGSEAVQLFNSKIASIAGVRINIDGAISVQ